MGNFPFAWHDSAACWRSRSEVNARLPGRLQKRLGAQSARSVLSRGYYCSVVMCFYSVSLIRYCAACWFTETLQRLQQRNTNKHTHWHADTHTHTHTFTFRKLTACSQVKAGFASPCLRPLLRSSLWLPRTRRLAVKWDTIYHRRNNYWRHFIVGTFQANSPPISLS